MSISKDKLKTTYTSPSAEVLEMTEKDILCASNPNGMDPYFMEEWV